MPPAVAKFVGDAEQSDGLTFWQSDISHRTDIAEK
jgi:hypothetical protein